MLIFSSTKSLLAGTFFMLFLLLTSPSWSQQESRKHVVGALDNYYSLSLKYDVSIDELKKANPGISNPKAGDVLVIPAKGSVTGISETSDCTKSNKNKQETYKVALMIPFYLEQVADTLWKEKLDPGWINELPPFRFIQFYRGFMLAADSLRQKGLNVEIFVYDVDQHQGKIADVLLNAEMEKMDLIVGPFFKSSFTLAADFAKANRIPIINPLSTRNDILDDNPFVFKLQPSVESQPAIVARLVMRDYSDHNILLYVANSLQNTELIGQFKEAIERSDPSGNQNVKIIDYGADSISGFKKHASVVKPNLVIIYADNEVLPAALLSKLTAMKDEYRVTVIGLPEWEKFTNIESIYLMALNTNILMASYTDDFSEDVKGFIKSYRARYFDEPLYYACSGFDAGYFFLTALMNYGNDFERCLSEIRTPMTQNQFRFEKKSTGGYDNVNWNVLQYLEYSLLKKSFY